MKRSLLSTALLLGLVMSLAGGTQRPAAASDWLIGGAFDVGGVHFSLAFDHSHGYGGPAYYRTRHHVRHDGYRCGAYCLKRSGYVYHHPNCPVVLHHFRLHRFPPARAWDYYRGPAYYGHRDYGYRDYGYRGQGRRDYGYRDHGHRDYGYRGRGHHREDRYRHDYRDRHRHHDPRYCPYR